MCQNKSTRFISTVSLFRRELFRKMFEILLRIVFLVTAFCGPSLSHSSGGPVSRCLTMMPSHLGAAPQTTFHNYNVSAPRFVKQGETLSVTMAGIGPSDLFRGFMIQARITGSGQVVGRFQVSDDVRTVACTDLPEGAVATQTSNSDKSSITFQWVAPRNITGIINFQ